MSKDNALDLLASMRRAEQDFQSQQFLAPGVRSGRIRVRVAGVVAELEPEPADFEGWGVFRTPDLQQAELIEQAEPLLVSRYLELFEQLPVILVRRLEGRRWLAFPFNLSDVRQRFGWSGSLAVELVDRGRPFEVARVRYDGAHCWFQMLDRRADPFLAEAMRGALEQEILPGDLQLSGLTPEMRLAYSLSEIFQVRLRAERRRRRVEDAARRQAEATRDRAEKRLHDALRMGGGELLEVHESEDWYRVHWRNVAGEMHVSAVDKDDLTVLSAGICLSGRDREFDLQSLVGVVEGAWPA